MKMGPEGVTISVHVGAAPQIAGCILQLHRTMGRAAKIGAAAAVPFPGANYAEEAQELHTHHPLLLQLAS